MDAPDKWIILKLPTCYKVFATWQGGYLDGDAWRLNSGIEKVTEDETHYYFHGFSGSIYRCHKKAYGTSVYSQGVLESILERTKDSDGVTVEILDSTYNFIDLPQ